MYFNSKNSFVNGHWKICKFSRQDCFGPIQRFPAAFELENFKNKQKKKIQNMVIGKRKEEFSVQNMIKVSK